MPANKNDLHTSELAPLPETVQLSNRVYDALLHEIIHGKMAPGSQLKADSIAQQLRVSSTPVRDALSRLVEDGLVHKLPYQGWYVCRFNETEIRDLYEMRADLECFAVRLACARITSAEVEELRAVQATGQAALEREDVEGSRLYNQRFHTAIMRAARNSQLPAVFGQISLRVQMLSARTSQIAHPSRAVKEHERVLGFIANREAAAAQAVLQDHILSALEEILCHGPW